MFKIETPFRMIIAGPSMSGKSVFISKLIKENEKQFEKPPREIYYCYRIWQTIYDKIKEEMPYVHFIQNFEILENLKSNSFVIFDNLATHMEKYSEKLLDLWTLESHHMNISVILVLHNLFQQTKSIRTISLNTNIFVLFRQARDQSSITTLGKQMFPGNARYLLDSYKMATDKPFGYLFINLNSKDRNLMLTSNIFEKEAKVYLPHALKK